MHPHSPESAAATAALDLIAHKIEAHPRSQQVTLGCSEVGHPCPRWLAYKLAGAPEGMQLPAWRPTVGTAVHTMLGLWLDEYELAHPGTWLTDTKLVVGDISPGHPLRGTLDAFHIPTRTVVDFKVPGPSAMKTYRGKTPESEQYFTQIQSYAYGMTLLGIQVEKVAILRLPSAGELSDAIVKEFPYDPQVAIDALARARTVAGLVAAGGRAAPGMLPAVAHYCTRCSYFKPAARDLAIGCPGASTQVATDPMFGGLLAG